MRFFIDNSTGNLCFLTFINSNTGVFEMEYEHGWMKAKINPKVCKSVEDAIRSNYTEIGFVE